MDTSKKPHDMIPNWEAIAMQTGAGYASALILIGTIAKLAEPSPWHWDRHQACVYCKRHVNAGHAENCLLVDARKALKAFEATKESEGTEIPNPSGMTLDEELRTVLAGIRPMASTPERVSAYSLAVSQVNRLRAYEAAPASQADPAETGSRRFLVTLDMRQEPHELGKVQADGIRNAIFDQAPHAPMEAFHVEELKPIQAPQGDAT